MVENEGANLVPGVVGFTLLLLGALVVVVIVSWQRHTTSPFWTSLVSLVTNMSLAMQHMAHEYNAQYDMTAAEDEHDD